MTAHWLTCLEPVHIGGTDSSSRGNNNPIFRLSDRTPVIPGSSLRGALRESAEENSTYKQYVDDWFGKEGKEEGDKISPGCISLGWVWPVWFPVHVLGYGNWWVSCPQWLNRYLQLSDHTTSPLGLDPEKVYISEPKLHKKTVYLRWLKLTDVQKFPKDNNAIFPSVVKENRRIVVPDDSINLLVEMALVRQPRVSLLEEPDKDGSLIKNLFSVEGFPPGAVFFFCWHLREVEKNKNKKENEENNETKKKYEKLEDEWQKFLVSEHYLGGLWSIGYGRINILDKVDPRTSANG